MLGTDATYVRGDTETMDYTPSGAITVGQIVIIQQILGIAHLAIAANELGNLNIGGGEYIFIGDAAIAVGKPVYWDATAHKATETSAGHKYLGLALTACAADAGEFRVMRTLSGDVAPGSGG